MYFQYFSKLTDSFQNTGESIINWFNLHGINIAVILVIAWVVNRFGAKLVSRLLAHTARPDLYPTKSDRIKRVRTLNSLSTAAIKTAVVAVSFVMILAEVNPKYATALFASAGLFTVALGFGARDLINDFIKGMFIIYENQYRVGDIVEVSGVSGTVEAITIRTTVMRDVDGNVHHIPNGSIVVTTNKTVGYSKLNEELILPFDTDIELVTHIVNHIGEEMIANPELKNKIKRAPVFGSYNGYAGGGISVKIEATVTEGDRYFVRSEFYKLLDKAFKKHGIQPQGAAVPTPVAPS